MHGVFKYTFSNFCSRYSDAYMLHQGIETVWKTFLFFLSQKSFLACVFSFEESFGNKVYVQDMREKFGFKLQDIIIPSWGPAQGTTSTIVLANRNDCKIDSVAMMWTPAYLLAAWDHFAFIILHLLFIVPKKIIH